MSRRLLVRHGERRIGVLEQGEDGRFAFTYDGAWLDSPQRFQLSLSLPLQAAPHQEVAHHFFSNLLPEADVRRLLCQRLGISVDNDFELLKAIGGECAGALTLLPEEASPGGGAGDYRPLSLEELGQLAVARVLPAIDGRAGLRLSLAGAQDKLPVRVEGSSLLLPLDSAPSTHILKFPNRDYKHLPANEVFTSMVARSLGLPVVKAELWKLRREGMCVVTRYDRVRTADGQVVRLHQEDLCQALGVRPAQKYEKEGGPGFRRCFETVRDASADPLVDGQHLLRWMAFNVIALNSDGHAKNLALLYLAEGVRLAPFYDLVCTRAYPRLTADLAMAVGGVLDPTEVRRLHWESLARELGLTPRFVIDTVRVMAERLPEAVVAAEAEFRERYGDSPVLQRILPKVRKQARRVVSLLA